MKKKRTSRTFTQPQVRALVNRCFVAHQGFRQIPIGANGRVYGYRLNSRGYKLLMLFRYQKTPQSGLNEHSHEITRFQFEMYLQPT